MAEREIFQLEDVLKDFIIDEVQRDPSENSNSNLNKYRNLKLIIDSSGVFKEPNFKVQIGMFEAYYTIEDCTKLSGALTTDDEIHVRNWYKKGSNKELLSMYWQSESIKKEKLVITPFDLN